MNKILKNILIFLACLIICFIPAIVGSYFTSNAIPIWYDTIEKPSFNPPNWIFGPVWTLLYITMAISLYFIVTSKTKNSIAIYFFFTQLLLNGLWSILFFGLKNPLLAFIEILFLWGFILTTIITSSKVSKTSSLILIPYLLWVSFASILNYFILILN
ncbi:tryptophan-rich sensory protein [Candidatus Woesearchaeota archaeon]|nr:tryptophan-rich sensory protein [Candidatus Woesearchaeota archaeon]